MKFSIRDLLWLIMVIGLTLAWALTQHRMDAEVERSSRSVHEIERMRKDEVGRLRLEIDHLRKEILLRKHAKQGSLAYPF